MKTNLFYLTVIMLTSCSFFKGEDKVLSLKRVVNQSSKMRLDGFYYHHLDTISTNVSIYIFYQDGRIMHPGAFKLEEFDTLDSFLLKTANAGMWRDIKWAWGLFNLENDTLKIERWYFSTGEYITGMQKGVVLNDTTFHMYTFRNSYGIEEQLDDTFHFYPMKVKPDSINDFIK